MFEKHHYYATLGEAVVGALDAGVVAVDSGGCAAIVAALGAAIAAGNATVAALDAAIARQFEMRFRVGEFDSNSSAFPFAGPYDESAVDGPAHRALAREAAAAGMALLKNDAGVLPLDAAALPASIAVIGPWADPPDAAEGDCARTRTPVPARANLRS